MDALENVWQVKKYRVQSSTQLRKGSDTSLPCLPWTMEVENCGHFGRQTNSSSSGLAFFSPPHSGRKRLILVGGFNPSEKYQSKWESSPGMKIKHIWNHHLVFHNPKNHQLLKTGGETGDPPPKKTLRNKGVKQKNHFFFLEGLKAGS